MKPENFKELKEKLISIMITKRKIMIDVNPGNSDYSKGCIDGYEEAIKDIKRVFEWIE